ncbi:MAG: response regulator [Undibacterium sp.]|nr:response regulator [Opitutaceae bacterium]
MPPPSKVLVVDDTLANVSLLLDALSDAGYELFVAANGRAALDLVARTPPDLVLLDVMMPVLDGFAACSELKAAPRHRDLPVIFMTALSEPDEKVRAFAAGAVDYIVKPFYLPEVLARVSAHLQIRALQKSVEEELAMRLEAEDQLSASLDRAVVVVVAAPAGRILFCTRPATALLYRHFPAFAPGQLPAALLAPNTSAELTTATGQLTVRRFIEPGRDDFIILHLEEKIAITPDALRRLGLTAREAEVLFWIAQGKSNPDVATILTLGVRTVHKHVEHIFEKLGCETRAAAALTAAEILRTK